MNISIIGSRGIPAKYGGFEVFTEGLSTRLVDHGYSITVTCESNAASDEYGGVKLVYSPYKIPQSPLKRKLYEVFSDIYFIREQSKTSDIIYLLGMTAGWATCLPKMLNRDVKIMINIDGMEWKRTKFNIFERAFLWVNTKLAEIFCDIIIIDSKCMLKHVSRCRRAKAIFIPYAVSDPQRVKWDKTLLNAIVSHPQELEEITEGEYWLVVARLEPENNIHIIIDGFLKSKTNRKLIIVGNFSSLGYQAQIQDLLNQDLDKKVLMIGGIYNNTQLLNMLRQNCFAYLHGHTVGGTNPSLLDAMSMRVIIVAHDNEFNKEVCQNSALYFNDSVKLAETIDAVEQDPLKYSSLKDNAYRRVISDYSWEYIVNAYTNVFGRVK
jgi:rhamnosyltransferase